MSFDFRLCDPAGIRTQDPYIKSVMLYRLSYGIISLFRRNRFYIKAFRVRAQFLYF